MSAPDLSLYSQQKDGMFVLKSDRSGPYVWNGTTMTLVDMEGDAASTGPTAAKQDIGNASLASIDGKVATTAKQDTGNTSLNSIDTKLTSQATAAKQDTAQTSLTAIAAAVAALLVAASTVLNPTYTFTRPADTTAYAVGDLLANSTTAGSVVPMEWIVTGTAAGSGHILRARLMKSGTVVTNASFLLYLFKTAPTVTNGDNGAFLPNNVANRLGTFTFSALGAYSDGAGGTGTPTVGTNVNFKLASGQKVYGLLYVNGAYTPISAETFTVELEVLANN